MILWWSLKIEINKLQIIFLNKNNILLLIVLVVNVDVNQQKPD
jgi:hypothetical protein